MTTVMAMKPNLRACPPAKKVRAGLMAALVAIATLTASSIGGIALAPVASGAPLTCKASMSDATPKDYTSTNRHGLDSGPSPCNNYGRLQDHEIRSRRLWPTCSAKQP